jgi:hypothetical protein
MHIPLDRARKGRQFKACFYCGNTFFSGSSAVGDHFPLPKRHGGVFSVNACGYCHAFKDNLPLYSWPTEAALKAVRDLQALSLDEEGYNSALYLGHVVDEWIRVIDGRSSWGATWLSTCDCEWSKEFVIDIVSWFPLIERWGRIYVAKQVCLWADLAADLYQVPLENVELPILLCNP